MSLRGAATASDEAIPQLTRRLLRAFGALAQRPLATTYPNRVSVQNIPAYRHLTHIPVTIDGKTIHGDVAWGGNWFFLVHDHGLDVNMSNLEALTDFSWRVREQLTANGITGADGAEIDHVELFASNPKPTAKVLSSAPAKPMTALPAAQAPAQNSLVYIPMENCKSVKSGNSKASSAVSSKAASRLTDNRIIPTITGEAWVMSEGTILVDERDPFGKGI
jgi:4-hydroxyproline epimerase